MKWNRQDSKDALTLAGIIMALLSLPLLGALLFAFNPSH